MKVVVRTYIAQGSVVSFRLSTNSNRVPSLRILTLIPKATGRHVSRLPHELFCHCHSLFRRAFRRPDELRIIQPQPRGCFVSVS